MRINKRVLVWLGVAVCSVASFAQIPGESWVRIGLLGGNISAIGVSPSYEGDGIIFAAVAGSGLARSTDRGLHWTVITSIPTNAKVSAIAFAKGWKIDNSAPMWAATDQGHVYMSKDGFNSVTFDTVITDRNGTVWPVSCLAVPWAGSYTDNVFAGTLGGGVSRSTDGGQTYANTAGATPDCRALAAGPSGQVLGAFYSSKLQPVYQFVGEWSLKSTGLPTGIVPTALHIASSNDQAVWLGTEAFGLWRSTNAAASWGTACGATGQGVSFSVGAVAACPNFFKDGEAWEGRSDGLFISTDGAVSCSLDGLYGSVTSIAFAPEYHVSSSSCDAFIGTTNGLFLKSCAAGALPPPEVNRTPQVIPVDVLAMSRAGTPDAPGVWGGSPGLGLIRGIYRLDMLQYNASGAFNNRLPNIAAVRLPYSYKVGGTCGTDSQTVFVAEKTLGVFRSQDDGASWTKLDLNAQGAPTWPSNVMVNDLAVVPNYLTGTANREILYAATTRGIYRWDGSSTGWVQACADWIGNVTRVAVPLTYDKTQAPSSKAPYHCVFFASDNHVDATTGLVGGLFFSYDDATRFAPFTAMLGVKDITAIGFSRYFGITYQSLQEWLAFVSRATGTDSPSGSVFYNSYMPASGVPWCSFDAGLGTTPNVRDMEAEPRYRAGSYGTYDVHLALAASDGPYYCDFDRANNSDGCGSARYLWKKASVKVGFQCPDTLSITYATQGSGMYLGLGTPEDGIFFSTDYGVTYQKKGTGYTSLPNDVYSIMPHMRMDTVILFASSPTYGVFVSTDKGASFKPWNAGSGAPCVVSSAYGLGMMPDRIPPTTGGPYPNGADVVWAGSGDSGIVYRPILYDANTNTVSLDDFSWINTNTTAGRFERFEMLDTTGQQNKIRASSPTLGFYTCDKTFYDTWNPDNSGLTATTCTAIRYGYQSSDPVPVTSGQTVAGSVGQAQWNYYSLNVPYGTTDIHFFMDDLDDTGPMDPDMYIRYGALPTETLWDYRPYINGDESVCVLPTSFTLLNENFEETWGPYGNVPPPQWTIYDYGDEAVKTWNTNDWYNYDRGDSYGHVARVYYYPVENQNEWLMSPAFSIPSGALSVNLEYDHYFQEYSSTGAEHGQVWYRSNESGWILLKDYNATTANMAHETISLLAHRGETNVQILFLYTGYNGWQWQIDNVKVSGQSLNYGTWYIGVRGFSAGTSSYELTSTLNSGCTSFAAPVAGTGKAPVDERALIASILPGPLAPTAGSIWGTVNNTGGGGGVWKGTDSTAIVASPVPGPSAITWEQRNGSGAGALTNLNTQCVQQLPDLTLVAGCLGNVFYSPAPDQGLTTWVDSTAKVANPGSNDFRDLLLCSNGDLLIAANGTGTGISAGGVWLSGDKGRDWMKISEGFDAASQRLEDLAHDTVTGNVQYYTSTDGTGLYTRTITAQPYPTVTSLLPNSGPTTGNSVITVTGTGFSTACPTGDPADCQAVGPVVLFGDKEVVATYDSPSSLTCTVPAHAAGVVLVTVRNPDTRQGGTRAYNYTCTAPLSLTNNSASDIDCTDSGVSVTWSQDAGDWADEDSGTRTYDVLRNGAIIASSLSYGTVSYTDTTGTNGTSYTYQVRYRNGCGVTATTTGVSAADYVTPGAPSITSITDQNACAQSGIQAYFNLGSGATQHALLKDGVQVVDNYKSGDPYNPGDTASHAYVVRAFAGTSCYTDSLSSSFADANNTPGAPVINAVTDNNPYAQDGVRVTFTGGAGAASHQLWKDGGFVVASYASGDLYDPGDTLSHSYVVRAVNGSCTTDSASMSGTDQFLAPLEVPNDSLVWTGSTKDTLSWSVATGATGYRVYRADQNEIKNLPGGAKVCVSYDGADPASGAILTTNPPAGSFYWYLAVGYNGAGEGSAGTGRVLSSTGACATP